MRIFAGVPRRGASNDTGVVENGNFSDCIVYCSIGLSKHVAIAHCYYMYLQRGSGGAPATRRVSTIFSTQYDLIGDSASLKASAIPPTSTEVTRVTRGPSVCLCLSIWSSVTLVHPDKAVGRNEMPFCKDIRVVSNITLY